MSLLDFALQYAGRGWPVFRLTGYKTPLKDSHGHRDATTDQALIRQWWSEKPRSNIGLATGDIVVLDLDGPGALTSPRGASFAAAAQAHGGLPPTLTARTARGLHIYLRAPAGVQIRSSNERRAEAGADGIDIKGHGGFVVLPPSVNKKNNFTYQWLRDVPIAEVPGWLKEWIESLGAVNKTASTSSFLGAKPDYLKKNQSTTAKRASKALSSSYNVHEHQRVAAALATIPADHYDTWIEIGLALHSLDWERSDGTSIGFDLWDRWSASCPAKYNPIGMAEKWASFGRTGRAEITIGTLYHLAAQHGWQPPAPRAMHPEKKPLETQGLLSHRAAITAGSEHVGLLGASDSPSSNELNGDRLQLPPDLSSNGHHVLPDLLPRMAEPTNESPLIQLNDDYAVIGDIGGKCLVLGWVKSKVDETIRVPSFQTFKSFTERFANKYVVMRKPKGEDWVEESAQLGSTWLKWKRRKTYDGIDLEPAGTHLLQGNIMNLWQGFAVQPRPGDWSLMKRHIATVLARGDIESLEYIMKWAAWKVQHPGERAEVALVFKGPKGAGKGTFANALRNLFGQHGLQIWNSKHLVGSFNGHLRNCLLLYADEAFWAGDKQGESVLKGMLTEPSLMIEQKGVDATPWKNRIGMIMTANADWVVPASHDERRYAVFEVSSAKLKDETWFKPLYHEMANGGMEAMLYDLQRVELKDWHPRRVPQTEALQQQKLRSLAPLYEWFEGLLSDGTLGGAHKGSTIVPSGILMNIAKESVPRLRDVSQTAIGRFLSEMGCEKVHSDKGNGWRFQDLAVHRARWVERFGNWKWGYVGAKWVVR